MKKRSLLVLGPLVVAAAAVGFFFAASVDVNEKAEAVELYHQAEVVPTQSVLFESELPRLTNTVKEIRPCVVNISTTRKAKLSAPRFQSPFSRDPFFDEFFERFFNGPMEREQKSLGSGFVINEKGHILTNRHVIAGADEVMVYPSKGKKFEATIVGEDDKTDIAVLKVESKEKVLPFCQLGDSDQVQVGEWVLAMGNPFGLESTVTVGIVSAKGRVIGAGPYDDFIQTDASINPGNSGGPLFDMKGRVVGINTAIVASGQGIGFAIPINLAKDLIPQLITKGKVTRGWLGVGIQEMTPELAKSFGLDEPTGALVANVYPGSPADKGGLKAGDVIVSYEGEKVEESHSLPTEVARTAIGKIVTIGVLRDGKKVDLKVTIQTREDEIAEAGLPTEGSEGLGIKVRDLRPEESAELGLAKEQGGVYISQVEAGSPAARADMRAGDILLSINGKKIKSAADYGRVIGKIKEGQVVRFFVRRGEMTIFLAFTK